MIRAVIFDLDGVILDSMAIWEDLSVRFLEKNGIRAREGLTEIVFSMSMEQGADYLRQEYPLAMSREEVLAGLTDMLRDFYYNEVKAKPGAKELMEFFQARKVQMIAATSSPRDHVTQALRRNGLLFFLTQILTTSEENTSKHEPYIYRKAAELAGSKPKETLVFEDSLYALKTAADDGFVTVGVFDSHGEPDQEGMKVNSVLYIRELKDFLENANSIM